MVRFWAQQINTAWNYIAWVNSTHLHWQSYGGGGVGEGMYVPTFWKHGFHYLSKFAQK